MIIENFLEKQIVERDEKVDQDILFFGNKHVMVMEAKKGIVLKVTFFKLPAEKNYQNSSIEFLTQRYREDCPDELIINSPKNVELYKKQLFSNHKSPVKITVPDQGIKMDLLMLCKKNYDYRLKMILTPSLQAAARQMAQD